MENLALPSKIEFLTSAKANEVKIQIQPCQPGFGTTLGNALRRVLLSSLPGGAITAFKVKNAAHEFTTLDHVKEDVVEITLNLKHLRFKIHSDEPVRLQLKAKGAKTVKAKDISPNSDVEIVSPEAVIATLTDKNAELEMEFIVERGRGYLPVEAMDKEKLETGLIAIDAIFTPLRNVAFTIENIRVGDVTNFENLILTIETDGSSSPQEALKQATQILLDHFNFIAENTVSPEPVKTKAKKTKAAKAEIQAEETMAAEIVEPAAEKPVAEKPKKRGRPRKETKPEAEDQTKKEETKE